MFNTRMMFSEFGVTSFIKCTEIIFPELPHKMLLNWTYPLVPQRMSLHFFVHRFYRNDEGPWLSTADINGKLPQSKFSIGC
jgi:hypothetical protein